MTLATSLVVLFNCYATADILTNFYSNASCFSLLLLYLGNSQVSVYRTIGPTLFLAHRSRRLKGELIVYEGIRRLSVVRPSTFSNDISSEAEKPILFIFHI